MLPPANCSQDAAAIVSRALSMRHHARQDPYCTAGVPEIHAQGLQSGPAMDSKTVHIISGAIPACFSGTGKRMKSRAVDWLHSLRHAGSAGIPPSRGNSKWKHFYMRSAMGRGGRQRLPEGSRQTRTATLKNHIPPARIARTEVMCSTAISPYATSFGAWSAYGLPVLQR